MTEATRVDPASPEAPRRRYLTILFSDLTGSTQIAGEMEAEDYADLLDHLRLIYDEAVSGHGGVIAQISGDGMLALFGYPESREGDSRRAVETTLELHERVRRLNDDESWAGRGLTLHSGIDSGLILFNEGDSVRGRFEVHGSATNVASRLCSLARPDEILVTEAALGPERHLFLSSGRRELHVKGKDRPVPALSISGRAPISGRYAASVRGGLTPFVGREAELRRLQAAVQEILAGRDGFFAVTGPAGVGKTRLTDEALRYAASAGCHVHRGRCDAQAEPLQPFLEMARSAPGLLRLSEGPQSDPHLDEVLSGLAPTGPGTTALRDSISLFRGDWGDSESRPAARDAAAALCAFFRTLAANGPLVLFIDDWQFADDASREMLAELRAGERPPILILVTARPGLVHELGIGDAELLPLSPFDDAETAEAVSRLLPAANPFVVESVRSSSGGNALFIEELCHSIASGGQGPGTQKGSPWLDTLIESRFSRLPEAQAALVSTAAVIGNVVPSWLLELITGVGQDDALVAGLAEQDFLFPGEREGTVRFKHGITREAIYDSIGLHARKALHLHVAEALRTRGEERGEDAPYEALAYHYNAGGNAEATVHYAELAGDRAAAAAALDRAQIHYRMALAALERMPQSDEHYSRWGRIAQSFGRAGVCDPSREQLPIFERALAKATLRGDRTALVWAEYWLGYINYALGEPVEAIAHYERSLEAATSLGDQRFAVAIRAALGQTRQAVCDYDLALPLLDEAIEARRRDWTGAGPRVGIAYSLSCKGFALGDMGRFEEARDLFDQAMAAIGGTRRELEASVLDQRSAVCLWQGRMEEALRFAEEGERLGERIRSLYDYAMSRALGGYARWKLDRAPAAVEAIAEATSWLEESGRYQCISLCYGWLADALADSGRGEEARRYAARALLRARKRDRMGEAMALRALARVGGRKPPHHYLERALASAAARKAPHEIAVTRLCAARLSFAAGNRTAGLAMLAEARQGFAELDMGWYDGEASRLAADANRSA